MGGTFHSLKKIVIRECEIRNTNNLVMALTRVANSLKDLEISDCHDLSPIPIGTLLWTCQNLKRFAYSSPKMIYPSELFGSVTPSFMSSLTILDLSMGGFKGNCLGTLITHCPKLRVLRLDNCNSRLLPVIYQRCPYLEFLLFNDFTCISDLSLTQYESDTEQINGLQEIIIGVDILDHFKPLLNGNCKTIKRMELALETSGNSGQAFSTIGELTQLEELTLTFNVYASMTIPTLFEKIRSLQSLIFISCNFNDHDVSNSVARFANRTTPLKSLVFNDCTLRSNNVIDTITQFKQLQEFTLCDDCDITFEDAQRLLRHFARQSSNSNDGQLIMMILDIPSLTSICIGFAPNITAHGINSFCKELHRLPIKELTIYSIPHVTDVTLTYLYNVKTLKEITFTFLRNITPEGVKTLQNTNNINVHYQDGFVNFNNE
ncbi:hypothetical protein BDA99DRAFT_541356 [Phascolomyces articulosus]|uniref:Uncharacterized protein n=1 Tax=Phascolomyces articulosus TaxID=60185 RepID=A0AAD5JS86_9FUNG|nr:hypothetical protein BDA99DRAFT_541356 [Phascolomyces articulosus]